MCLAQGHNTVMPLRLKPVAPLSGVKHSTTEPLCSHNVVVIDEEPTPDLHLQNKHCVSIIGCSAVLFYNDKTLNIKCILSDK